MKRLLGAGLFFVWVGSGLHSTYTIADELNQVAGEGISFSRQVIPVLRTRCAVCHMTGTEPGNMRLFPSAAYDSIVGAESVSTGRLLVSAGNPDESYLLHKIRGTHLDMGGEGSRMPQGQAPLSQEVITLIEMWVAQGAERN